MQCIGMISSKLCIDICPFLQQQLHNFNMPPNCCCMQCIAIISSLCIDIYPFLHMPPNCFCMQCSAIKSSLCIDICTILQQQSHNFNIPPNCCCCMQCIAMIS